LVDIAQPLPFGAFLFESLMKLTVKQEAFCLAYIETGNASEAYRRSYDVQDMKPESINRKAKELIDNGKITARVAELQQSLVKRHEVTVDSLMLELEEARMAAMGASNPQSAAAVAATMGKAKLAGLLVDRVGNPDGTPMDMSVKVSFVKP